jgi:riboflavin kinase / FMN adenylyltransferase
MAPMPGVGRRVRNSIVERWLGLDEIPEGWGPSVVTIGVFDGVHRGHQRIVVRAAEAARELGLPLVVVTFDPHPSEVIRPGSHPALLCSLRRRVQLLAEFGADAVCVLPFTLEFSHLSPDEFVRAVLADRLHARRVVVGENFRFGYRAAGDLALMAELGEKYDFRAEGIPLLAQDGVTMSSSAIRDLVAAGDVAGAARGLGRPHRVEGVVVRGEQRGRALGVPTANLETAEHTAIPADGVYAGWLASLDAVGQEAERGRGRGAPGAGTAERGRGRGAPGAGTAERGRERAAPGAGTAHWPAAISVGTNPTFDGEHRVVEAHALDRDDLDLYGVHVAVDFAARLRGMVRFDSVDALVAQMRADIAAARVLAADADK